MGYETGGYGYIEQARNLKVKMTRAELLRAVAGGIVTPSIADDAMNERQLEERRETLRSQTMNATGGNK